MDHRFGAGSIWYYMVERASWRERAQYFCRGLLPPRACLGDESRWHYLARFVAHANPRVGTLLGLPTGPQA